MGTADSMDGAETNGNNQGDNCLSVIIRYAELCHINAKANLGVEKKSNHCCLEIVICFSSFVKSSA